MLRLKDRIILLKESTNSLEAKKQAEIALQKYGSANISGAYLAQFENFLAGEMLEALKEDKDTEVLKFVERENRILAINNLGVRDTIKMIKDSDLMNQPTIKYMIENLREIEVAPEYLVAEQFIQRLQPYMWNNQISEHVEKIKTNIGNQKEDIALQRAIKAFEHSSSDYLLKSFETELDSYFVNRTPSTRTKLIEKLSSFKFDHKVNRLINILKSSDDSFQIKESRNTKVNVIYSPVIIEEGNSIFFSSNKFLRKNDEDITVLTEEEIKKLPPKFIGLCQFLAHPNVSIKENSITIFSKDKKVEIFEDNEEKKIKINEKDVTLENFNKIFMNSGIFHRDEVNIMNGVYGIVEAFDTIFDIDFAKRISSTILDSQWADVYNIGEKVFVHKFDRRKSINEFKNLNATTARSEIKEFLNFDIAETFREMLTKEETLLKAKEETKKDLLESIDFLNLQKVRIIEALDDRATKDGKLFEKHEEVLAFIKELDGEIVGLTTKYNKVAEIKEPVEVEVEVEVEEIEMDESFSPGVKVSCKCVADGVSVGTITGFNGADGKYAVLLDDGNTLDCAAEDLEVVAEIAADALPIEENIVNEDDTPPGTKVTLSDGTEGTIDSWNDAEDVYVVAITTPTEEVPKTVKVKDGEFTIIKKLGIEEKKEESVNEDLASGDKVRLKNGTLGTVESIDDNDKEAIIIMDDGVTVSVPFDKFDEVEIVDKKAIADSEEEQRQRSAEAGSSVELEEAKINYVEAEILDENGDSTDEIVKMDALEYTSSSDKDMISIKDEKGKVSELPKSRLKPVE